MVTVCGMCASMPSEASVDGETLELLVLGFAVHAVERRVWVFSSSCATATLARIMHSSIRRWASLRMRSSMRAPARPHR